MNAAAPVTAEAHRIYLDYNATSPLRPAARSAMKRLAEVDFGNPSSVHLEGRAARSLLEHARRAVAAGIGARPQDVVLTGSATEANNLALKGLAFGPAGRERRHIVTSAVEHPSVLAPAGWLARAGLGITHELLGVDGAGRVDPDDLADAVTDATLVVSVVAANNETGTLVDIAALADVAHERGALLHVDAAQALGRVPVDVESWGADLVTLSSHKVGGPKGAGALWVRGGLRLEPLHHGGHQERNRRGGTESVAAYVGFGAACEEAVGALPHEQGRLGELRDRLWQGLHERVDGIVRLGVQEDSSGECLPNTLNVAFTGADGESLLMALDLHGVAASSGSACTAGSLEPSHVLEAMGVPDAVARSAVRFSVGWGTNLSHVERALDVIPPLVELARGDAG